MTEQEKFEAWIAPRLNMTPKMVAEYRSTESATGYSVYTYISISWAAWQACKQHLVVELEYRDTTDDSCLHELIDCEGHNSAIYYCEKQLKNAGIEVIVKNT